MSIKQKDIAEYWKFADVPSHPGSQKQTNVIGLYGDDCKYNAVGEKLIAIAMNLVLHEAKRSLSLHQGSFQLIVCLVVLEFWETISLR